MSSVGGAAQEYGQDQLKVFSHEGDAVDSLDLNDVKTELEEAADMAEVGAWAGTRLNACLLACLLY